MRDDGLLTSTPLPASFLNSPQHHHTDQVRVTDIREWHNLQELRYQDHLLFTLDLTVPITQGEIIQQKVKLNSSPGPQLPYLALEWRTNLQLCPHRMSPLKNFYNVKLSPQFTENHCQNTGKSGPTVCLLSSPTHTSIIERSRSSPCLPQCGSEWLSEV